VETVREVRDDIEDRVESLFDDVERVAGETQVEDSAGGVVTAIRNVLSR
jgi:arsenate reductase